MRPIAIHPDNSAAIEQALAAVNGRAHEHTYTVFAEINALAVEAEQRARQLLGAAAHTPGALWTETSGSPVNNTYARKAFKRAATRVVLQRRPRCWALIDVQRVEVWRQGGGPGRLTLTPAQAERALAHCRAQFEVAA